MDESYPAKYRDKYGEEITTIHNDGKFLRITVRGVTFSSKDFDSLESTVPLHSSQLESFTLHQGSLCDCEIKCEIPMSLVAKGETSQCHLHIHLTLGAPRANGSIDNETLQLRLDFDDQSYSSCGQHGWFEDELIELQGKLPESHFLKCCFNCAFSDYSPAGSGLFGNMLCFRDNKQEYLAVNSKVDLFRIWDTMTEMVQETYLCPEFVKRAPRTGYRG